MFNMTMSPLHNKLCLVSAIILFNKYTNICSVSDVEVSNLNFSENPQLNVRMVVFLIPKLLAGPRL